MRRQTHAARAAGSHIVGPTVETTGLPRTLFTLALSFLMVVVSTNTTWSYQRRRERQQPMILPESPGARKKNPEADRPRKPPKERKEKKAEEDSGERAKLNELREQEQLPKLRDLPVPTVQQLHAQSIDWIVLKAASDDKRQVITVKAVDRRPDTLGKMAAELEKLRKEPRGSSEEERAKQAARRHDLQFLIIELPGESEGQFYEIPVGSIDQIIYHEDLIIRRASLLMAEKKFRDGFELLFALERQSPGWSGLKEATEKLLFLEAKDAVAKGDLESALLDDEELHHRNQKYPGLDSQLGDVADHLIRQAKDRGDFRQARHFLGRLVRLEPKHPIAAHWTDALSGDARRLRDRATELYRAGRYREAVDALDACAREWPATADLPEVHREISERYQRLQVGVQSLAGASETAPFETLADARQQDLTRFNLEEVDRIDDLTHYRSRIIEQWEPTDLGRRAAFGLRPSRAPWESRSIVTAADVMATIEVRLDRANPSYDERLASYIRSVRLRSPFEFEVIFRQVPVRTEPIFRFPVTMPSSGGSTEILSRKFEVVSKDDNQAIYRRSIPQPDGLPRYQVAEIVEHRYDTPERALQGLFRGEVSMLPDLPTWAVDTIRQDPRFFFLDYAIPTTHVVQFNPRSPTMRHKELRMALAYGLDLRMLLERFVLRDRKSHAGRLVTAPFAMSSYAYNSLVLPRETSLARALPPTSSAEQGKPAAANHSEADRSFVGVAASLAIVAKKRFKTMPHLKLLCDPNYAARQVATEMIRQWKRIGIDVELIGEHEAVHAAPGSWDLVYRQVRMREPLWDLWPFLTLERRARLEALREVPDWLRQELLALDSVADWKSAVSQLHDLHAHLYAEFAYIPLWEVDDAIVLRKNIHDFPPLRFLNAYQDIERWVVQSWFPEETR